MNNYSEPEKKEIKNRGWIAVVFTIISVVISIVLFFISLDEDEPIYEIIIAANMLGFIVGGLIPGITHLPHILSKLKLLIVLPYAGLIILTGLIICIPLLGGWLFMLIDLVKFLMLRKEEK